MFNFNLVNKAFGDERITPTQFKMLYLIVNNCSMNNTTTIKMFNGFMADKMGLSVRMMQYNIKQLEDCGYIEVKRPIGRNAAKKPNEITLLGVEDDTPYNSIEETVKESTQINCAIDYTPYKNKKEYKNNISMYRDHETDVTNEQVKLSKDELKQRNEYISSVYGKLDDRLNYLYSLKTDTQYEDVCSGIVEVISDAQEHRDWFTSPQWDRLTRYCERFDKLTEAKDKYFNSKNTKIYVDESSSIEEEMASAHEPSDDEGELISTDVTGTSSDKETTHDVTIPSVDGSNDDLTVADRLTLLQSEDRTPPSSAAPPLTEEFSQHVRAAIRNGVYQWSLTLTEIPDYITGDDYTQIVGDALRAQPDYESHLGNISLSELSGFTKELMENRLNNKDIPAIVRQNQYNKRHEAYLKELMTA